MEPDFSGYVTKANLKCTDGRTISSGAFAHQDGEKLPLVYNHNHTDVNQVLGNVILTKKPDGMWGDAYLNKGVSGVHAKMLVQNGDIDKFSVWAKDLDESGFLVHNGNLQEVSLVLAGANPGAQIHEVLMHNGFIHSDSFDGNEEMYLVSGEIMKHSDTATVVEPEPKVEAVVEPTVVEPTGEPADVLDSLSEEQEAAINAVIETVVTEAVTEALTKEAELTHNNMDSTKGPNNMSRNAHQNFGGGTAVGTVPEIKHSDMAALLKAAKGPGGEGGDGALSLRQLVRSAPAKELMHADTYGVDNLEVLFPDAQALMARPVFVDRRQEWVRVFLAGTGKSPFSRVKTFHADITADEARARGYIKGNAKVEEVFPIFKRSTGPAWIYKKQKLDRQDIIDVVSFDLVAWMKVEMRGKLDEELARAAMFGDGRPAMVGAELNPDKIPDPGAANNSGDGIRAIVNDNDLFVTTYDVPLAANATGTAWNVLLDRSIEADEDYRGSGNKTGFVTYRTAAKLLTIRDDFGHRIYRNLGEVAGDMGVNTLVKVPTELFPTDVLAIVLDLSDYNFGTDRGGELTFFDDFDIDFNQYKYLYETYLSGALVTPYAAQIFKRVDLEDVQVTPTAPTQVDNVVTVPTITGVTYKRLDTGATVTTGAPITLDDTVLPFIEIEATPSSNAFYFGDNHDGRDTWTFEFQA